MPTAARAKNRLTEMEVQEVSLVDHPANMRKFVLLKRNQSMPNSVKKDALKLPGAAKGALMDGLGKAADQIAAMATVVGEAVEDDTAVVPEDLVAALSATGEMLGSLGEQFATAPPADAGDDAGAPEASGPPAAPPPPAPEQKSADEKSKDDEEMKKGLPSPQTSPPNTNTPVRDGEKLSTLLHKTIAAAHMEVAAFEALDKAGRKMAGARYKKLEELHGSLGKLLNELSYDDATEAAAASGQKPGAKKNDDAGSAGAQQTPPPAQQASAPAPAAQDTEALKVAKAAEERAKAAEDRATAAEKKNAEAMERIEKMRVAAGGRSNAGTLEQVGKNADGGGDFHWPEDLSADLQRRKKSQNQGAARR